MHASVDMHDIFEDMQAGQKKRDVNTHSTKEDEIMLKKYTVL